MNKLRILCAICGLLVAWTPAMRSQSLTFNTLAGYAGPASADGSGSEARFNAPGGAATDNAGTLYVADTASHTIRKITAAGVVSTLAGLAGSPGTANGTGNTARFFEPQGVAVDSGGNVYVADTGNHTIRKITPAGVVSTLAGLAGSTGSTDGTGNIAQFYRPESVAVDSTTNVYVADAWNHTIRKITPAGVVSTLAGSAGDYGSAEGTGGAAKFYLPQGIAVDSSGTLYVGDTGNHTIRKITSGGAVSTLAGSPGNYGSTNATGSSARFYGPAGVSVDTLGTVYVADHFNHTIRKVTSGGLVTTLAGSAGNFGSADGIGSSTRFWGPQAVAVDTSGNVFVADTGNSTIRKVTPGGAVTTEAGSASIGSTDWVGSGARFYWPAGAAVDNAGNIYVADTENHTIRKITPAGAVSTFAGSAGNPGSADGTGGNARFSVPQGVAADSGGNLYVADTGNATIRKLTPAGVVTTWAGSPRTNGWADGPGSSAQFYQPQAVAVDSGGNLYVADTWNQTIRKITPDRVVTTLAGAVGIRGSANGTNSAARFNWPAGVAVDTSGNVYVADFFNHQVRKITPAGRVSTLAGMAGVWGSADGTNSRARLFQPQGIAVDSGGNLFVVDSGNHTIRKMAQVGTNWVVSTVAGLAPVSGSTDGVGSSARFFYPAGMALNSAGACLVADWGNNTLRLGVLVINGAPAIITQPQSRTVDPGSSVSFNVGVTGNAPLFYQWRFNATNIAAATGSTYSRENVQAGDAGNYSVMITNQQGAVTSADAQLLLNGPPLIVSHPQSQTVMPGQSVTFTVSATGPQPFSYQWQFNGLNIPEGTNALFTLPSVRGTDGGSYSVVVANRFGGVTSSAAVLGVRTLQSWGDNSFSQTDVPSSATEVIAMVAGGWHSLALRADGTVLAWGNDSAGQCAVPSTLKDAVAIAAGGYHSLAIKATGKVAAWGSNDYDQTNVPPDLDNVIAIAAGAEHSLALRRDGTVVAWGDNSFGQCDLPADLRGVVAIAAGGNHSLALLENGTVIAWGENTDALGNYAGQSSVPLWLTHVVALAAGDYHSLAVRADGTVVAWGDNSEGQCDVPTGLTNVVAAAGGGAHTLALKADGALVAWGANWNGQCSLPPLSDVVGLGAGEYYSLALVAGASPVPQLLSPAREGSRFSVLVQSLNRKSYALDYKEFLAAPDWSVVSTNSGNGSLKLLSDPAAAGPQRYYRSRQW